MVAIVAALTLAACAAETSPEPKPQESGVILDQPMPAEADIAVVEADWKPGEDPLHVENIDVADSSRMRHIEGLKAGISEEWAAAGKLKGISTTVRRTQIVDEEGLPILDADGDPKETIEWIREYWFEGSDKPNYEGDEIEGTGFVIPKGWEPPNTDRPRTRTGPRNGLPPGYMPPYGPRKK